MLPRPQTPQKPSRSRAENADKFPDPERPEKNFDETKITTRGLTWRKSEELEKRK